MSEESSDNIQQEEVDQSRHDPRTKGGFSVVEDAILTWFFLCCPFLEHKKLTSILTSHSVSSLLSRFLEIMKTPELMERIQQEYKGDVLSYKPAPFSNLESYYLVKALDFLNTTDFAIATDRYPMLFHPSRTLGAYSIQYNRLSSKNQHTSTAQQELFMSFVQQIREKISGETILPFPGNIADPETTISEITGKPKDEPKKTNEIIMPNFASFHEIAKNSFTPTTFAVLVGFEKVHQIDKIKTILGRFSPKSQADIDVECDKSHNSLSKVSRHHAEITLAKDMRFYLKVLGKIVLINGKVFTTNSIVHIKKRDLIDIGGYMHVFFENPKYFN